MIRISSSSKLSYCHDWQGSLRFNLGSFLSTGSRADSCEYSLLLEKELFLNSSDELSDN